MIDVTKYCEAAANIREDFGLEKSLKYLIGEKFHSLLKQLHWSLSFVRRTEELKEKKKLPKTKKRDLERKLEYEKKLIPELMKDRDLFVAKIREIYEPYEIKGFLDNIMAFGAAEQFLTEDEYEEWLDKGALEKDIVDESEDILILEEMKELLTNMKCD